MEKLNRGWSTLVSVGMVVYGVAVIWQQMFGLRYYSHFTPDVGALVVAVPLAAVGIAALVLELLRQPDDPRPHLMQEAVESFARAWRLFWRTIWLKWVFGSLAAISIVGGIIRGAVQYWMMAERFPNGLPQAAGPWDMPIAQEVFRGLPFWSRWSLFELVPRVTVAGEATILPIVVIVLLFWLLPRVMRLRSDPECAGKVGFFTACAVLLACISALSSVEFVVTTVDYISFFRQMNSPRASAVGRGPAQSPGAAQASTAVADRGRTIIGYPDGTFGGRRAMSRYDNVPHRLTAMGAMLIGDAIFCAMLMGGLIGGLTRMRKGEAVNRDSFVKDSMLCFEALLGVYLVYWVLWNLPLTLSLVRAPGVLLWIPVPIFALLMIYAPFAPVTQRLGFTGALHYSTRTWRNTFWATLRLVAVGAFVYTLSKAPSYVLTVVIDRTSWAVIALSPIYALIGVGATTLIMLAVWEFYSTNVLQPEHALEERG
jgi:hypothetical protein